MVIEEPQFDKINPPIRRKFGPDRRRCICISLSRAPTHLQKKRGHLLEYIQLENFKSGQLTRLDEHSEESTSTLKRNARIIRITLE